MRNNKLRKFKLYLKNLKKRRDSEKYFVQKTEKVKLQRGAQGTGMRKGKNQCIHFSRKIRDNIDDSDWLLKDYQGNRLDLFVYLGLILASKTKAFNFCFCLIFIPNKKGPQSCQFFTSWWKALFDFMTSQTSIMTFLFLIGILWLFISLTLSWRRSLSYRNHCHLLCKLMSWFLYERDTSQKVLILKILWSIFK